MASASWRRAGFKYPALISLAIISLEAIRKGGLNDLVHGVSSGDRSAEAVQGN